MILVEVQIGHQKNLDKFIKARPGEVSVVVFAIFLNDQKKFDITPAMPYIHNALWSEQSLTGLDHLENEVAVEFIPNFYRDKAAWRHWYIHVIDAIKEYVEDNLDRYGHEVLSRINTAA